MSKKPSIDHADPRGASADVAGYDALAELALDLRWSWNHATDPVWRQLDPVLWALTHNPWVVLQTVARDKLQRALSEPAFRRRIGISNARPVQGCPQPCCALPALYRVQA
jgi:starch phosphorylase